MVTVLRGGVSGCAEAIVCDVVERWEMGSEVEVNILVLQLVINSICTLSK